VLPAFADPLSWCVKAMYRDFAIDAVEVGLRWWHAESDGFCAVAASHRHLVNTGQQLRFVKLITGSIPPFARRRRPRASMTDPSPHQIEQASAFWQVGSVELGQRCNRALVDVVDAVLQFVEDLVLLRVDLRECAPQQPPGGAPFWPSFLVAGK
jgi:hypothetical protein